MLKRSKYHLILLLFFVSLCSFSQNETNKWYFGWGAGLDFMTNPPTILTNGVLNNGGQGCATISDAFGNLLFYTEGSTIYDRTHAVMSNGFGLNGGPGITQTALIAKQPGNNNIYYVFIHEGTWGIKYSIVDMNLSAGNGSVTVKNVTLTSGWQTQKMTGTRHCNGQDVWIVCHDQSTNFESYLLTSTGMGSAVISSAGSSHSLTSIGYMKLSPTGKKIAVASQAAFVEVLDFDNSTGIVSNPLLLTATLPYAYGCEFSPDGSKLYATATSVVSLPNYNVYQWDLCAGSNSAIISSQIFVSGSSQLGTLQLASNGKIYVANPTSSALGIINNPNVAGSACNYVHAAQSIGTKTCGLGLPNFISSYFKPLPAPFTYTANNSAGCQAANFMAPSFSTTACAAVSYSLTGYLWNFGDPLSAGSNTSGLANPGHTYSGQGTYTAQLIIYYSCGGGTDTLRQVVTIPPCVSVSSTSITCANLGSATVTPVSGLGPYTYTWLPGLQTGSVATGLIPGTYSVVFHDAISNVTSTSGIVLSPLVPLTGTVNYSGSLSCPGATTGSASVTGLSGGSGSQTYLWTNGSTTYSSALVNTMNAANWSVTVTDALTSCIIYSVFTITQPPSFSLTLSSASPSVCLGGSIALTGTNSGGTPAYTYTWSGGPTSNTHTVNETSAGQHTYTLTSSDANNCLTNNTVAVNFIANPVLSLSTVSICPLQVGTLTVSGASSYTWTSSSVSLTGSSFTDSPSTSQQYTVVGEQAGCSSQSTTGIVLYPLPNPVFSNNSPRCNGDNLSLNGAGGSTYLWSGPNSFSSALPNTNINPVTLLNAGAYNLTVTAATGCTASITKTIVVHPTPTLSAVGTTVCTSQTLNLSAGSFTGATFLWTGPAGFGSTVQNPGLATPLLTNSGTYTVKATSVEGCTNMATAHASVVSPPNLTLSLSSNSMCAQALNGSPNSITLTSSGASTYTLLTPYHIGNPNPGGPSSPLYTLPPYNAGAATATLQGSNGICTASASLSFSVIPNPSVSVSSPTPVICAGQSYTYTSQGASSYTWSGSTPGITTYSTGQVAVASPTINSVFSVIGGSLGCYSSIQTTSITVNPLPVISLVPGTPSICLHSAITLSATGTSQSYTWQPYTGLNTVYGSTVNASPASEQTYTVIGSLNNCSNTTMITVSVMPLPIAQIQIAKPVLCLHETITLQGKGGVVYDWYGPQDVMYSGQTVSFTAGNSGLTGTYTLSVTDSIGCKGSTTSTLLIYGLPDGDLRSSGLQSCVPFQSDFTFYTSTHVVAKWQLEKSMYDGNYFSRHFIQAGDYLIKGKLTDTLTGCINTKTLLVNAYPLPIAGFSMSPEKPVEGLDEIQFVNTSQGEEQTKWNWYFIDNKGYRSQNQNTTYMFEEAGIYPVAMTVVNKWGCADTLVKAIHIESDFNLFVPNVFTPNADGLNDVFLPITRGVRTYELAVFNRWGARIFTTTELQTGWDGFYNGEACKNDVYVWKITLTTTGQEAKSVNGQVLLSR